MLNAKKLFQHIEKYETDDVEEFVEVNTFHCSKLSLFITPESCFQRKIVGQIKNDFFPCKNCRSDNINNNFKEVIKKRLEKRKVNLNEVELNEILKAYLNWLEKQTVKKFLNNSA